MYITVNMIRVKEPVSVRNCWYQYLFICEMANYFFDFSRIINNKNQWNIFIFQELL